MKDLVFDGRFTNRMDFISRLEPHYECIAVCNGILYIFDKGHMYGIPYNYELFNGINSKTSIRVPYIGEYTISDNTNMKDYISMVRENRELSFNDLFDALCSSNLNVSKMTNENNGFNITKDIISIDYIYNKETNSFNINIYRNKKLEKYDMFAFFIDFKKYFDKTLSTFIL